MEQVQQFKITLIQTEHNPAIPDLSQYVGVKQSATDFKVLTGIVATGSILLVGVFLWYTAIFVEHGLRIIPMQYRKTVLDTVASETFPISFLFPIVSSTLTYLWLTEPEDTESATMFGFTTILTQLNDVLGKAASRMAQNTGAPYWVWAILIWSFFLVVLALPVVYYILITRENETRAVALTPWPIFASIALPLFITITWILASDWLPLIFYGGLLMTVLHIGAFYNPFYSLFITTIISVLTYSSYVGSLAAKNQSSLGDTITWAVAVVCTILMTLTTRYPYYPFYLSAQHYGN